MRIAIVGTVITFVTPDLWERFSKSAKKNVRFGAIGPPMLPPAWYCSSVGLVAEKKSCESNRSLRR